jgi:hypothetical protein
MRYIAYLLILAFLVTSCKTDDRKVATPEIKKDPVTIPAFNANNAYNYIEKQLSFGTRIPGTETHKACKDWIVSEMKSLGAEVIEQDFTANIYNGEKWASTNIICHINPDLSNRILLSAHWDSRFIADNDPDSTKQDEPVMGADDAGSGVGILMEIASIIKQNPIDLGVDIIFWDAEDQGDSGGASETWCLGSQHWSRNKHDKNYTAKFGINLDMVGAKNPVFGKDEISRQYAGTYLNKFWTLGQRMGYNDIFVEKSVGGLTDDHVFVNLYAKIPMFDVVNHDGKTFQKCWHTHCDDLSVIDKRTVRSVGQVVTAALYKESTGHF